MAGALSQLNAAARQGLKVLADRLISAAGGPEKAALVTRVERPALSKYRSPHADHADSFMPLDVAAELTLDTAERVGPLVARHFAALSGCAVVALPRAVPGEAHRSVAVVARETGEVVAAFAEALADGRLTADEVSGARLAEEIDEAIESLLALKAVAEAAAGEGA
jgi:hypothetical protein